MSATSKLKTFHFRLLQKVYVFTKYFNFLNIMEDKFVAGKTVRAFNISNLILYDKIETSWIICPYFQDVMKLLGENR